MTIKPTSIDDFVETGCGRCKLGGTPQCKVHTWTDEIQALRGILNRSALVEQLKWCQPCYTYQGKNIVIIAVLKQSIALSWLAGAAFSDPQQLLEKPGENSNHARYFRFQSLSDIQQHKSAIEDFLEQAIKQSKNPAKKSAPTSPEAPSELTQAFVSEPDFETAFKALTPGRQRSWLLHFTSAKQSSTRQNRIDKAKANIYQGKGWNER